ncbi:hypothetical protein [Streptomyces sp. NPDC002324]
MTQVNDDMRPDAVDDGVRPDAVDDGVGTRHFGRPRRASGSVAPTAAAQET